MGARYAYYEDVSEGVTFDSDDVLACDDVGQLREWLHECEAAQGDIRTQLDAHRIAGKEDDAWVYRASRALGFFGSGQTRIKRRMRELGHDPNPEGTLINDLNRKLVTMKAEAAFARNFVEVCREQFADYEFKDLCGRAELRLSGARRLAA